MLDVIFFSCCLRVVLPHFFFCKCLFMTRLFLKTFSFVFAQISRGRWTKCDVRLYSVLLWKKNKKLDVGFLFELYTTEIWLTFARKKGPQMRGINSRPNLTLKKKKQDVKVESWNYLKLFYVFRFGRRVCSVMLLFTCQVFITNKTFGHHVVLCVFDRVLKHSTRSVTEEHKPVFFSDGAWHSAWSFTY